MKKYLFALTPAFLGIGLCFLFSYKEAVFVPDTDFPHVDPGRLSALAGAWLLIGLGLSFFLVLAIALNDVVTRIEKAVERRSIERSRRGG
ncbi:MAG: hypothetical protein ACYTHM_25140 [Planctomycetota bacterium]|jgi:hypothetical protein